MMQVTYRREWSPPVEDNTTRTSSTSLTNGTRAEKVRYSPYARVCCSNASSSPVTEIFTSIAHAYARVVPVVRQLLEGAKDVPRQRASQFRAPYTGLPSSRITQSLGMVGVDEEFDIVIHRRLRGMAPSRNSLAGTIG